MPWPNFTITLIVGAITGLLTAYFANRRKKNPILWFFVGFLFGLFGLLFFFMVPQPKKKAAPIPVKPIPQPYLSGPSDKFWYYLDATHTQVGPMSYIALSNGWKQGKIKPDTFVWHEDLSEWSPLKDLIRIKEAP